MKRFAVVFCSTLAFIVPLSAYGYPNGTPHYITDTGPFCASCHSAVKAEYMPELPREAAMNETPENKHYGLIRSSVPVSPYNELTAEQKEAIIKTAKEIDSNSAVTISAPKTAKPGENIKVTIKARGGDGPAICVMLVDKPYRYQARPVSADGWYVVGEPEVTGQDGTPQKSWFEHRIKGLKTNLNFINITGQKFDLEKKVFPSGSVTYTLRAPLEPGRYTLTAAFLYGTENADKAAFFQRPSGRILFSDEIEVEVR